MLVSHTGQHPFHRSRDFVGALAPRNTPAKTGHTLFLLSMKTISSLSYQVFHMWIQIKGSKLNYHSNSDLGTLIDDLS